MTCMSCVCSDSVSDSREEVMGESGRGRTGMVTSTPTITPSAADEEAVSLTPLCKTEQPQEGGEEVTTPHTATSAASSFISSLKVYTCTCILALIQYLFRR